MIITMIVVALIGSSRVTLTSHQCRNFIFNRVVYLPFGGKFHNLIGGKPQVNALIFDGFINSPAKIITEEILSKQCFKFDIQTGEQPLLNREEPMCLVNFFDNDVGWHLRLKYQSVIMYKDTPSEAPYSVPNKAKSESNILKFIIDNYDRLPISIISIHQYEKKPYYMKGSIVDKINSLNRKESLGGRKGFINLNDVLMGSISPQLNKLFGSGWWSETMEPWFGPLTSQGDFTLGRKACAQYVVHRDNILSNPKIFYEKMYSWLINKSKGKVERGTIRSNLTRNPTVGDQHLHSNWHTSRFMEWTWELIFTRHRGIRIEPKEDKWALYFHGGKVYDVTKTIKWNEDGMPDYIGFGRKAKIHEFFLPDSTFDPTAMLCTSKGGKRTVIFDTDTAFQPVLRLL